MRPRFPRGRISHQFKQIARHSNAAADSLHLVPFTLPVITKTSPAALITYLRVARSIPAQALRLFIGACGTILAKEKLCAMPSSVVLFPAAAHRYCQPSRYRLHNAANHPHSKRQTHRLNERRAHQHRRGKIIISCCRGSDSAICDEGRI